MSVNHIAELAGRGTFIEITAYQLWQQPDMTSARPAEVARAAGDRLVLASTPGNPTARNRPKHCCSWFPAVTVKDWTQAAGSEKSPLTMQRLANELEFEPAPIYPRGVH